MQHTYTMHLNAAVQNVTLWIVKVYQNSSMSIHRHVHCMMGQNNYSWHSKENPAQQCCLPSASPARQCWLLLTFCTPVLTSHPNPPGCCCPGPASHNNIQGKCSYTLPCYKFHQFVPDQYTLWECKQEVFFFLFFPFDKTHSSIK